MSRELTKREKLLLLVLVVMVLALGYFKLILEPINDQVSSLRAAADMEQAELQTDLIKAARLQQMRQAIEEIKASGDVRSIPQYDNSENLMVELHRIMSTTLDYSLDCSAGVTQEGYIVMRPVVLTFRTSTYDQARQIVDRLCDGENVCQISDVSINARSDRTKGSTVETTLAITYFEIMP